MKPHLKIETTVGVLQSLTNEQFAALRDNVLREGCWEQADGIDISGGGDHLGVRPLQLSTVREGKLETMIYLGIEKDGYTHS